MEKIDIKDVHGLVRFSTPANEGSRRRFYLMKEDFVTLKFSTEHPVYFQLGDYCEIGEGLFELVDLAYPSLNRSSGGYEYELRLDAPYWKWKHKILFYDRQGNKEASWSLTRTPDAHLSVILSNLASLGYTFKGEAYESAIDYSVVEDKPIFLQYNNTNIIDALTMLAEACKCEWWVEGNRVFLGKCELAGEPLDFELWKNVEEMARDKGDSTYATRIYAFGSTRNITPYYRKELVFHATETIEENGFYVQDGGKPLKPEYFLESTLIPFGKTVEEGSTTIRVGELHQGEAKSFTAFTCKLGDLPAGVYKFDLGSVRLETYYGGSGTPRTHIRTVLLCSYTGGVLPAQILEELYSEWDFPRGESYVPSFKSCEFDTGGGGLHDVTLTVAQEVSLFEAEGVFYFNCQSYGKVSVSSCYRQSGVSVRLEDGPAAGITCSAVFNPLGRKDGEPDSQLLRLDLPPASLPFSKYRIIGLKYDKIPSGWFTSDHAGSDLVVEGIVEKRLMLPLGTAFIGDKHLPAEQVVEQVVVFEDVFPKRVGVVGTVTPHEYTERKEDDKGHVVSEEKWEAYRFTDADGNFHFSKDYLIPGRDLYVTFQSGALAGMKFKVWFNPYDGEGGDQKHAEKNPDGTWNAAAQVFEVVRNEDYGRKLPCGDMKPRGAEYDGEGNVTREGDRYILEGYDTQFVSDSLVPLAEEELKEKAQKYAEKLRTDPSVYNCKMRPYEDGRYASLSAGQRVNLLNKAYFENGRQSRILGFEHHLDCPYDNPVYMVGESQVYSRIGALEEKVDSLVYNGSSYAGKATALGGGSAVYVIKRNDNTPAGDNNVYSALRSSEEFLSKTKPDTTNQLLSLLGGIISDKVQSQFFSPGTLGTGFLIKVDPDTGKSYIEVDELFVRIKAMFTALEIKKLTYAGGNWVFSPAGMKCSKVDEFDDYYRCYFTADDGETQVENEFRVDDQVRNWEFNIKPGVYENVSNRYYWRKCIRVGKDYIDLSKTDRDPSSDDAPQAGDSLATMGNRTDKNRQSVIAISAYGEGSPSVILYEGISEYSLLNKDSIVISPHGSKFKGDFFMKNGENLLTFVENMFKNELNKYTFFFEQSNNFLSNAVFIENLDAWEVTSNAVYADTSGLLWLNGGLFLFPGNQASIKEYKGTKSLYVKNNGVKQSNSRLKDWIDDEYFVNVKLAVTGKGFLTYGFSNGDLYHREEIGVTNGFVEVTSRGRWNGEGDFSVSFSGEAYISYVLLVNKDSTEINRQSVIEQLVNRITFSVSKNNVVSAINMSEEGVKIEGKTIELKGAASFNGNVQITEDGKIKAKNAYIEGEIHATKGTFSGEINATSGTFKGEINATSGRFVGAIGSPYIQSNVNYTTYPSVKTGMNIMVTNISQATAGIVLPIYEEVDGVECDIMNVTTKPCDIILPISCDIGDKTSPHIYYRQQPVFFIQLEGECSRVRLRAFIRPGTAIYPTGTPACSWAIMNTSDFELVQSGTGKSYFVKSIKET